MRRSVFFAVCLGLVLSLLKETPAETPADTPVTTSSITTEKGTDNGKDGDPREVKSSEPSGNDTGDGPDPNPPVVPTSKPTGNDTGDGPDPNPPVAPTSKPTGNDTGDGPDPNPPVAPTSKPTGNDTGDGPDPNPPVVPTSKPTGNDTGDGPDPNPPVVPTSKPTGNDTGDGPDPNPPVVPTSKPTGNDTGDGPDPNPPVVPTSKPTGNDTGDGPDPNPPVVPTSKPTGNDTGDGPDPNPPVVPTSKPTGNDTGDGPDPNPPVVPTSKPTGNDTGDGPDPNPPVVPTSKPTGNDTDNETDPTPPVVPTSGPSDSSTVHGTDPDATDMPTSAPTVDFCHGDPCGGSSATCISLQSNYTCVCEYGYYYSNKNCYKGEVYPATISVNTPYSKNFEIVNSTEYQELSNNVSAFFKEAFKDLSGYVETVIMKIQPASENRNSVSGLYITVTNLFTEDSDENATTVSTAVIAAIKNGQSFVNSYQAAKHCDIYECNLKTTVCEEGQFPECKCKPDLEKTKWDVRSCSVCSASCSAAKHKYCVQEEEGPTCKCMINFKKEAGECVACPVGYSGEECSDNSELILIIVGTVFGAIILCLVIAVSVISVRAKHKQNPEKRSLIRSGYSDTSTSDDRPSMFPRVQTTSGHANPGYQPNNPYEMRSRNRDHFPERDYDDLYEISREPTGFRTQSRY